MSILNSIVNDPICELNKILIIRIFFLLPPIWVSFVADGLFK